MLQEIQHANSPALVAAWIRNHPAWLEVHQTTATADQGLRSFHLGEREAIALAQRHQPDALLLIDEEKGRRQAEGRNIRATGTLGVLNDAATRGLVDLPIVLQRLRETNFRASPRLLKALLDRDVERKRRDAQR